MSAPTNSKAHRAHLAAASNALSSNPPFSIPPDGISSEQEKVSVAFVKGAKRKRLSKVRISFVLATCRPHRLPRHATRAIRANGGATERVSTRVLPLNGVPDFLSFPQLPAATGRFLPLRKHHILILPQLLRVQNLYIHGCRREARPCTSKRASRATGQCCNGTWVFSVHFTSYGAHNVSFPGTTGNRDSSLGRSSDSLQPPGEPTRCRTRSDHKTFPEGTRRSGLEPPPEFQERCLVGNFYIHFRPRDYS